MPLVPYETALAARGRTARAVAQPADAPDPDIDALDLAAASFRLNNIAAGGYEDSSIISRLALGPVGRAALNTAADLANRDETYDPLTPENLAGFEDVADRFIGVGSPEENARVKERITGERHDQQVIAQAGGWGLASSIAAGLVDPVTLAS